MLHTARTHPYERLKHIIGEGAQHSLCASFSPFMGLKPLLQWEELLQCGVQDGDLTLTCPIICDTFLSDEVQDYVNFNFLVP